MIGVQAGGEYWLMEDNVGSLEEVPPISPVPLTHPWFRGLVAVEGNLHGVVDLSALTAGVRTPVTHDSRLVLPESDKRSEPESNASPAEAESRSDPEQMAVLVSSLVGERSVAELNPFPEMPQDGSWEGPRVRDNRGRVWKLIKMDALMRHPQLQDICA